MIPDPVRLLLSAYVAALERDPPGYLIACYLHGSLALNAFQPQCSDIDFISVISRRSTGADLDRLAAIHRELERQYPDWPLSGSYLQMSDLGKSEEAMEPSPYYHDGVLHPAGYHDINAVTWWLLKNRGLTLVGPLAADLPFIVDWDQLIADMRENLNTYWVQFVRKPARMAWLLFDKGVQWAVLGVLRQYYTFEEGDITSKVDAGEYALNHLSQNWHRIVQEALNIRCQSGKSLYASRLVRAVEARRLLRHIISKGNMPYHRPGISR